MRRVEDAIDAFCNWYVESHRLARNPSRGPKGRNYRDRQSRPPLFSLRSCKTGSVSWTMPVKRAASARADAVELKHKVE